MIETLYLLLWFIFLLACFFGAVYIVVAAFSRDRKVVGRKPWVCEELHRSAQVTKIGGRFSTHPEKSV